MRAPRNVRAARIVAAVAVAVLALAACTGEAEEHRAPLLPPAEAAELVSELLYQHNLIADPEVNAKMNEFVLEISRDGVEVDSVIPEFHR